MFVDATGALPDGLWAERCERCGGRALADARYTGLVHCSACWAVLRGAEPVAPAPAGRIPPAVDVTPREPRSPVLDLSSSTSSGTGAPAYRVLVPARPATGAEVPGGAQLFVARVAEAALYRPHPTYALAEDVRSGALIHSCAVRLVQLGVGVAGYAIWENGVARGGHWRDVLRTLGLRELQALAVGEPYVPPAPRAPVGRAICPRCGIEQRVRADGEPYAHRREEGRGEGGELVKVPCVPTEQTLD